MNIRSRLVVTAYGLLLISIAAIGGAETINVRRSTITSVERVSHRAGFSSFKRDVRGGDHLIDLLEVRVYDHKLGFSLPLVVLIDNDGDQLWDELYYADCSTDADGPLWGESIDLKRCESWIIGTRVNDPEWNWLLSFILRDQTVIPTSSHPENSM